MQAQAIFRSPFFAMLESYAPQLLAGPDARVPAPRTQKLATGQVGVFGVLGQNDWFADSDYADIRASVRRLLADPSVGNIDLVIDSPGGSCLGLKETADLINQANKQKPVRGIVTGICASAAFWLGSQAGTLTVSPSGEIGSVGILDISVDVTKALEASGIKVNAVSSTAEKIERSGLVPLSDDARAYMQAGVNAWYADFLSAIRRGRGARVSPTSNYGGGRMLSSREALREGLIDFIGGIQ